MKTLHMDLIKATRQGGYRSLAMPTLATGGQGIPPHIVAIGALQAIHSDILEHPSDPMRVRIACFEAHHIPTFNSVKDEVLLRFYQPDEAMEFLTSNLFLRQ